MEFTFVSVLGYGATAALDGRATLADMQLRLSPAALRWLRSLRVVLPVLFSSSPFS
jgi:hypothetical protein